MTSLAQQTLFLPFENGILPPPDDGARVLAFGIEADTALDDAWKKALTIIQPLRPDYLKLERAGFHAVPRLETAETSAQGTPLWPAGHLPLKGGDYAFRDVRHQSQTLRDEDGELCQPISPLEGEMPGRAEGGVPPLHRAIDRFDAGLMLLGKHRGRNEQWFADLLASVAPGGWIVVCGDKKLGIDSFRKWAEKVVPAEDRLSKNHAVAFWMKRPADLPDDVIEMLRPAAKRVDGRFHTAPGMFSHGEIDKGSALLAHHLEGRLRGAVADFGAGWGYLSAECLKYPEKIERIDLYEADFEALEAARGNLASLAGNVPLSFHWQDLVSEPVAGIYDTIVMNPPFHEGRAADVSLGQAFIAVAARRLKPGGRLLLVANRQLPYEATLKPLFRSVETLEEGQGFKVIEAKR